MEITFLGLKMLPQTYILKILLYYLPFYQQVRLRKIRQLSYFYPTYGNIYGVVGTEDLIKTGIESLDCHPKIQLN